MYRFSISISRRTGRLNPFFRSSSFETLARRLVLYYRCRCDTLLPCLPACLPAGLPSVLDGIDVFPGFARSFARRRRRCCCCRHALVPSSTQIGLEGFASFDLFIMSACERQQKQHQEPQQRGLRSRGRGRCRWRYIVHATVIAANPRNQRTVRGIDGSPQTFEGRMTRMMAATSRLR